jgi:hypothetical protein
MTRTCTCTICGTEFTSARKVALTCGAYKCRMGLKHQKVKAKQEAKHPGPRNCTICQTEYLSPMPKQTTCADEKCMRERNRRYQEQRNLTRTRPGRVPKEPKERTIKQTANGKGGYKDYRIQSGERTVGFDMGLTRWAAPLLPKPARHVVAPDLEQVIRVTVEERVGGGSYVERIRRSPF